MAYAPSRIRSSDLSEALTPPLSRKEREIRTERGFVSDSPSLPWEKESGDEGFRGSLENSLDAGLTDSVSASTGNPTITYLKGTYNGVATRVSSGSTVNIIAVPSIFLASGSTGTIADASSRNFLLQGKSLSGVSFAPKVVYSSGALPSDETERLLFSSGIVAAYSGTSLATNSDIRNFLDNTNNTGSLSAIGGNFIRVKFGGNGPSIVSTSSPASNSSVTITNSLMFDGSSSYLSRTPSVSGS